MKEMLIAVVILIVGFVLLIKGADFFVDGSSSVAKRLRVPSMIIGLTIVSMGTSLPECAVSVTASLHNDNSLAVSNVVGSNLFNLMVVCGICALFTPLLVNAKTLRREFPFSIICAILLLVFGYTGMVVGRFEGIFITVFFIIYLLSMVWEAKKARANRQEAEGEEYEILPVWKCLFFSKNALPAVSSVEKDLSCSVCLETAPSFSNLTDTSKNMNSHRDNRLSSIPDTSQQ